MTPITKLLQGQQSFEWNETQQQAFDDIKEQMTKAPILVQHQPDKETMIEIDTSDYAIGARMTQLGSNNKPQPIAFYSQKMTPAELNYDIHDKELLAIVCAFKHW